MNKNTGNTLWESNLNVHSYRQVFQHPGQEWLGFNSNADDFPQMTLTGTHANSIDGQIKFRDSTGDEFTIRSIAADMEFVMSGHDAVATIQHDGTALFNQNLVPLSNPNGRTFVGQNQDGSTPTNINSTQFVVLNQAKGSLLNPMTAAQMNAIASPADGLLIYNLDVHKYMYYNGTTWTVNPAGHTLSAPATGGTVNLVVNNYAAIHPAAAIATLTINFPSSPNDNDFVEIKLTQVVAAVTWGNGTAENPPTANVSGYLKFVFDSSTGIWY